MRSVGNSVWVTLRYTFFTTMFEMILGIGLALALEKPIRGASLFRTIFILPLMMSPIIVGLIWRYMLDGRTGVIPYFVERIGEIIPLAAILRFCAPCLSGRYQSGPAGSHWR